MGKATGFIEYTREIPAERPVCERIHDWREFHGSLQPEERRLQGGRCMDCGIPFCQAGIRMGGKSIGCPLHNLVPEWNDLIWRENPAPAAERLLKTNCFPEFTGRVCPALCEAGCTLGTIGEPVTVRDNELYLIEYAFEHGMMTPHPPQMRSGKNVAVIGSGPAGLSAAYWLNRRGHSVTVFERDSAPGGLLMFGIPGMKLPKHIVRRRTELMESEGVAFRTGVTVGRDIEVDSIISGYDSVIFACGAQLPRQVPFEGSAEGVCFALDYLKTRPAALNADGKTVAVVGAGDSASDCIATAIRQGYSDAVQIIRKPAESYAGQKTDYAHAEASEVFKRDIRLFNTTVKSVTADENGKLSSVALHSPEGERVIDADLLIIASGFCGTDAGFEVPRHPGCFSAGDMKNGATLVVAAIADGKRAAEEADAYMDDTACLISPSSV